MEWLIWSIIGAAVAAAFDWETIPAGVVLGFIYGLIRRSQRLVRESFEQERDRRLARVETQLAALQAALAKGAAASQPAATTAAGLEAALSEHPRALPETAGTTAAGTGLTALPPSPSATESPADAAPVPAVPTPDTRQADASRADASAAGSVPAANDARHTALDDLYARVRDWLFGGNTLVRLGVLVLFFGFAFLAKFAADHSLLPVEVRLAGVATGGLALLLTGWRLRERRRSYGLILQGGGVAVLYLTVFTALRLFDLLPAGAAFALLVVFVVATALLALLQDAQALAFVATAGGFAAPILASTGSGSHVALFGYYALLDAGVLALAWHRAWRPLNLLAFVFTFTIGLAWGARYYRPEYLTTTTPFLMLFWAMFVAAAIFYARHATPRLKHYVDGSLVFGVPVCGFAMLAGLLHEIPFALAYAALIAAAVYVLLTWALWKRPAFGLLGESFLALGIALLTLAVPLALDGRWTASAWALEGAALVWVGTRQQRRLATVSGLLLQGVAGLGFLGDFVLNGEPQDALPFLNGSWLGCALIALAGLLSGACCARGASFWRPLGRVQWAMLAWGCGWWLGSGLLEFDRWAGAALPAASLALFAVSGVLARRIATRSGWAGLGLAGLLPLAGMLLDLVQSAMLLQSPLAAWGWLAWPAAVAAHLWGLARTGDDAPAAPLRSAWHSGGVWLGTAALGWAVSDQVATLTPATGAWAVSAAALVPIAVLLASTRCATATRWPFAPWRRAYQLHGPAPLALWLAVWSVLVNLVSDGAAEPLPYLPLLNPLDLTVTGALLSVFLWWRALAERPAAFRLTAALGGVAFLAANGMLLRALHHFLGLPYRLWPLLHSDAVQAALALFWSLIALATMLLASRRAQRTAWMAGAALLGLTVLKLFVVDMAQSGTVARIVAFLGAGVLLLVVGYFSPLPPKQGETR